MVVKNEEFEICWIFLLNQKDFDSSIFLKVAMYLTN